MSSTLILACLEEVVGLTVFFFFHFSFTVTVSLSVKTRSVKHFIVIHFTCYL